MYARVPSELKAPLEREIRRIRFRSAIRLYVPTVLILAAVTWLGVGWYGHGLLSLIQRVGGEAVFSTRVLRVAAWAVFAGAALGTFFLFRHLVTKELYRDFPYCRRCDAMDFDEAGVCPVCGEPVSESAAFFFIEFEDERPALQALGLREAKRGPEK